MMFIVNPACVGVGHRNSRKIISLKGLLQATTIIMSDYRLGMRCHVMVMRPLIISRVMMVTGRCANFWSLLTTLIAVDLRIIRIGNGGSIKSYWRFGSVFIPTITTIRLVVILLVFRSTIRSMVLIMLVLHKGMLMKAIINIFHHIFILEMTVMITIMRLLYPTMRNVIIIIEKGGLVEVT